MCISSRAAVIVVSLRMLVCFPNFSFPDVDTYALLISVLVCISPDAKWPYATKACFGIIMNFYDWFIILDTSLVGIRRMPAWHPWGIF